MADVRLPDIKASVKVDSKDVDAGLNRVEASTKKAGKSFDGLQTSARGAIDNMSSSLTSKLGPASGAAEAALGKLGSAGSLMGPAIAGGAAIAGAAVAKFAFDGAQAFVGLAGEIRNFQRASGASAEDSSRFVAVLDDLGVESEKGATALFKLGKSLKDGGDGLRAYGIEIARNKDGTADLTGTMLNVADAYKATSDPAKRAELAFAAFGKQGQALIPVLEQGREGLKAFFEGAEEGRQIFSQEDLDKARAYELAVDDLQDTFRGLQLEAGEALLPWLTNLAKASTETLKFLDGLREGVSVAKSLGGGMLQAFGGPLAGLIGLVGGKSDSTKKSQKELAEQAKETAAAQLEEAEASEAQAKALDKVTNATVSAVSAKRGYAASLNNLKDQINDIDDRTEDYRKAVEDNAKAHKDADVAVRQYGAGSDEARAATEKAAAAAKDAESANRALRDAHLGVEQQAIATANAAVKLAEDTATAGGESLSAQEKADIFRAALISLADQASGPTRDAILGVADELIGLPNRTVYVDADTSAALEKIQSLERRMASISGGGDSTSGAQQFARGLDMGPVKGPPGAAVPIIAHAGEYVATPQQLAELQRQPSMPSPIGTGPVSPAATQAPVVHTTIVLDRKVLAEATSQGQYEARKR